MNEVQVAVMAVMALGGLTIVRLALAVLVERRAVRTFWRSLETARAAGVEEAFMARFNSAARIGESLDEIIRSWGAARIRRMCAETLKRP